MELVINDKCLYSGLLYLSYVTVSRSTSADVSVVLTATVTDCIQTYPPVTKTIRLGAPFIDQSGYVVTGMYAPSKLYSGLSSDYNELCGRESHNPVFRSRRYQR